MASLLRTLGPSIYPRRVFSLQFRRSTCSSTMPSSNFRLPTNVRPTHYGLTIKTDLEKETFDGLVKIRLQVKESTSSLTFNVADLQLSDISLYSHDLGVQPTNTSTSFDSEAERGTLDLSAALPADSTATLTIAFSGKLTGAMMGYYKSTSGDGGEKRVYALTQFEPTAARRAFPCWDEPLLKATFSVAMISCTDTTNLSNMPVISEEPYNPCAGTNDDDGASLAKTFSTLRTDERREDEWKITKFDTTPPMSTYIVAYANGHFDYLEGSYESPLTGRIRPLRIYATPDVITQAQYALDVKAKVLPIYEEIFDIEYPLPKLDTLVAHDFDAGAMENWGLITGRTSAFLIDLDRPDLATKQRITVFQSHEVAHMWFGNIATMEWWDFLYLNEGFATLVGEVIVTDRLYPEWKLDSNFITESLNSALNLDAKLSSHPIEVECPDANKINQIFDKLSYEKAASVLRMLCNFVGKDAFLKGVSTYLKDHLYGNTTTKDLWEGINRVTVDQMTIDIPKMMGEWVMKTGFPLLTVTETKDGIRVRQDRYLETGHVEDKDNQTIWTVPLAILTVGDTGRPLIDQTAVLDSRDTFLPININKPYKLNAGTYGVYRVLYPEERLARIAREAAKDDTVFSLNDRIGLVHDSMALAKSGHASVSSALTVVDIFRRETEFLVWDSVAENLSVIVSTWWENEEVVGGLNEFRKNLFKPIVDRLGYVYPPSESVDTSRLRTRAIGQAAAAGDQAVVNTLREMFKVYMTTNDASVIPADLFRITALTAVKYGGQDEYNFVKSLVEIPTTLPSVGISAMLAMCASKNVSCQRDIESFILNKARNQDIVYFFRGQQMNHATRRRSAEFFTENFGTLEERFKGNFSFKNVVSAALENLSTERDIERINKFFEDKDTSRYDLALAQTLDSLRASTAWIKRSTTDINEWLGKWNGKL